MPVERVGVFVDGPNLYGSARRLTGDGRVDVPALVKWIAGGRLIVDACFWSGQLDQSVDAASYAAQRRMFAQFEQRVPSGRIGRASLQRRGRMWVEKGVDVGVALDLVAGAFRDEWDTGVVVSGDGDLARAGALLRGLGKRFEVVCCARSISQLLRREADEITVLTSDDLRRFLTR